MKTTRNPIPTSGSRSSHESRVLKMRDIYAGQAIAALREGWVARFADDVGVAV